MDANKADPANKEKISLKDRILGFIGFACIPIFWANASEFIQHRRPSDLMWCSMIVTVYVVSVLFINDRLLTIAAQFAALAAFGTINSILRQTLAAVPAILVCALIAFLLLLWAARRAKSREPQVPTGGALDSESPKNE